MVARRGGESKDGVRWKNSAAMQSSFYRDASHSNNTVPGHCDIIRWLRVRIPSTPFRSLDQWGGSATGRAAALHGLPAELSAVRMKPPRLATSRV